MPGVVGLRLWGCLLLGTATLANPWLVPWLYATRPTSLGSWLPAEAAAGILGLLLLVSAGRAAAALQRSGYGAVLSLSNLALAGLVTFVAIEAVFRVYLGLQIGMKRGLLYGTELARVYRSLSQDEKHGYVTFEPHQEGVFVRSLEDPARKIHVRINNLGFRGRDVTRTKPENTTRIVTLGASSTFGFKDADDETYPYYLERMLRERFGGSRRFEVINLGIAHLTSTQIGNLFEGEALPLDPDIVTFYEGVNDTKLAWTLPFARIGSYLLAVRLLETWVEQTTRTAESNHEDLGRWVEGRSELFLRNLDRILAACRARGIPFFVISQQAQSKLLEDLRGVTYEDEWRLVHERFARGEDVGYRGRLFLIHHKIMGDLRDWVGQRHALFIDGIAALDPRRDTLTSWVHLDAEGNRILARAIADR
ncbi:MAG: SGNH/GDSL hydrolase family protein, partial [Myxococcota bacterium]